MVVHRSAAHGGLFASIVAVGGLVCLFAWVAWRFGPTITRFCGIASWGGAWACGSRGGYGYMIELALHANAVPRASLSAAGLRQVRSKEQGRVGSVTDGADRAAYETPRNSASVTGHA
jgi:hypothetical protein